MQLPTEKVKATSKSPKKLIIFSKPKVGKTSLLAELENNLIVDLENGTDFLDAMKVKCNNYKEIIELAKAIHQAGKPYKYITIDTATKLEDLVLPYAKELYRATPQGKKFDFDPATGKDLNSQTVLDIGQGYGYRWTREAFTKILGVFENLCDRLIVVGHLKETLLEKNGKEVTGKELDLTGKLKSITSANADAVGLLYRNGNQNILSFKTTDEVVCGARPDHLKNQEIVVSELIEGKLITHWDKIFID